MQQQSPSSKAAGDRWPLASRAGQFPRYAALQDARPFQRSTHTRAPPPRSLECWGWGAGERKQVAWCAERGSCFPRCLSESRRSCAQSWFSRRSSGSWRTPASCPHAGLKSPAHTDGRGNVNLSLGKDRLQNGRWPVLPRASIGESWVVVPCAWTPVRARVPQPERAAALGARWGWASRLSVGFKHWKRRPESDKVCCDRFSRLRAGALGSGPCICQFYNLHLR